MPYGTIGNSGRDTITNPDYFNMDFSLVKNTKLTERINVQIRAEFFDVLNHPNFIIGSQAYLMSTFTTINATNPNYNLLNTRQPMSRRTRHEFPRRRDLRPPAESYRG